jgi:hypothetical protein
VVRVREKSSEQEAFSRSSGESDLSMRLVYIPIRALGGA